MSENYVSTGSNPIEVPFSDDHDEVVRDDELLIDDVPASASPAERITAKEKRKERIKRLLDDGKQNAEEVKTLRGKTERLEGEIERLKGYVAGQGQAQRQSTDTGKDPYEQALDAVYERQVAAYAAAQAEIKAGSFNEERGKYYERVAREIETDKSRIHTRREVDSREPAQRQTAAQQMWVQKYPEVYRDPKAFAYAQATHARKVALGHEVTTDTVDEIMNETMAQFKLGPKKAPSANERARLSGLPSSGAGGGSGSGGNGVVMTKELRKMATSLYSDLPEEEAVKKWANSAGKELRKQKVL